MKKSKTNHETAWPFSLLILATCLAQGSLAQAPEWKAAPLNPKFLSARILHSENSKASPTGAISPPSRLGYRPGPVSLPAMYVIPAATGSLALQTLPPKFDLRITRGLPPIRDQGACGSCWAFAAYGSMESYLRYARHQHWDFSEQDMNKLHGFDVPECGGGDQFTATAYLARWSGPLRERQVPYPYPSVRSASALATGTLQEKKHVQSVSFYPERQDAQDNDLVKKTIYGEGGVFVGFEYRDEAYNAETHAYYTDSVTEANHGVTLVGWDDAYPRTNFLALRNPPGDGAFIVRNSWGSKWGEAGYFYLSYYDPSITTLTVFHNAESRTNYSYIYEYDPLGWTQSIGLEGDTAWFSNVFMAAPVAQRLKAVSTYTPVPNSRYELTVYDRVAPGQPISGKPLMRTSGSIAWAGYHTIKFPKAVKVTPKARFSVVIKLTTPGHDRPVPLESFIEDYSSAAKAAPGESFVSGDGLAWKDLSGFDESVTRRANVALKAFATP